MNIRISLYIVALAAMTMSCQKWLDVKPKTEVKADVLFASQKGFRDALLGVYALSTQTNSYGVELTMGASDVLAQQYSNVRTTVGHVYENLGKFAYTESAEEARFENIWRQQYKAIANCNLILANIESKKGLFTSGNYELIKGEALGLRAMLHFDLLRLFAPSPLSNIEAKAIPYIAVFGNSPVAPKSVGETLSLILADLNEAALLLEKVDPYGPVLSNLSVIEDDEEIKGNRQTRLNYYAVQGLLARVYLYQGDKPKALTAAKMVLATDLFPMFEGTGTAVHQKDYIFPTEHLFALKINDLKEKYADKYFPEITQSNSPSSFTITNTALNQLFPAGINTDYRLNWFDVATSNSKRITKYNFNTLIPILKKSEILLIAAESENDPQLAISLYMNVLRSHRGLSALDVTATTATELAAELEMEYRREFISEGQLFFYYKRLNKAKIPQLSAFPDPDLIYNIPIPMAEIEFGNII
ncbi:RagB/SusD family nutrient uptake outer membrane protein [Sphingobacterium faecale]|uniref:RagB/SusD family nutrient uptake outer membrane protein n=1 Tax=Sphingobacterium faecale TaxID=2803775 RepID=A0ABS1R2U0_9SPHI|nr:RagB/SusD family nutrient uptake outer membrane protein [Sphingobacterium faecale]MBL1409025.1 RagB/SusD family nutrient uptake outer membrane protein [Sphingobacterium faecale]